MGIFNKIVRRDFLLQLLALFSFPQAVFAKRSSLKRTRFRLAFGSCNKHLKSQKFWNLIEKTRPELWLSLGDNMYNDDVVLNPKPEDIRDQYQRLKADPDYKKFSQTVPMLGIWDDHDFASNDRGVDYKFKKESQQLFCDFFNESGNSPLRKQEGIYRSNFVELGGDGFEILLCDCRYFLNKGSPNPTILGESQ